MQKSQIKDRFKNARVLSDFKKICVEQCIDHLPTAPHTSAQNGGSERLYRMLVEHAACITHEAGPARELSILAVINVPLRWHKAIIEQALGPSVG
jgi:hypothetical protein